MTKALAVVPGCELHPAGLRDSSLTHHADVAELADARGSGPRDRKVVGVQVPPSALKASSTELAFFFSLFFFHGQLG